MLFMGIIIYLLTDDIYVIMVNNRDLTRWCVDWCGCALCSDSIQKLKLCKTQA